MSWALPVFLEFFLDATPATPLAPPCCSASLLALLGRGGGEWVGEGGSFAVLLFQFHAGTYVFLGGGVWERRDGERRGGEGVGDRDEDVCVVVVGVYWDHWCSWQGWAWPSYQIIICYAKLRGQKFRTDRGVSVSTEYRVALSVTPQLSLPQGLVSDIFLMFYSQINPKIQVSGVYILKWK